MPTYEPASPVAELATGLIVEHHEHLLEAPIVYVFVAPAPKSKGRTVLGRARRVVGLNAFLVALAAGELEPLPNGDEGEEPDYSFFVMEIAHEEWDAATAEEREALVDHELCHMRVDDEGVMSIVGHDVEEFAAVAARHGAWSLGLQQVVGACSTSPASVIA